MPATRRCRDCDEPGVPMHGPGLCKECADFHAIQQAEIRAETFATEALMGMRPGTTEGWYDEPEDPWEDEEYAFGGGARADAYAEELAEREEGR